MSENSNTAYKMATDPPLAVDGCPVDVSKRSAWLKTQKSTPSSSSALNSTTHTRTPLILEEYLLTPHDQNLLSSIKARTKSTTAPNLLSSVDDVEPTKPWYALSVRPAQPPSISPLRRYFWSSSSAFLDRDFTGLSIYKNSSPEAKALVSSLHMRQHGAAGRGTRAERKLSQEREVSTIPRADGGEPTVRTSSTPRPSNHEIETGLSTTGHWVYPSERQFYDAMVRKGHAPRSVDMKTIVPIHNAVNERAWREIQEWEKPWLAPSSHTRGGRVDEDAEESGRSKLVSFMGKGSGEGEGRTNMSPRARWRSMMGYLPPFDRHDWIVERDGRRVEYVIDFYSGKEGAKADETQGGKLSFYLDARPKLNTWEGWKMRIAKATGWV